MTSQQRHTDEAYEQNQGDSSYDHCGMRNLRKQSKNAKPDPALGYYNGELRFWLGRAQEVAGDHAAAQESWREARSELESFLKEQPENWSLIGDLALINMGLGDKAAALALAERAIAVMPVEKDAMMVAVPSRSSPGWRRKRGQSPTAPWPLYRNYSRYRLKAY